MVKRIFKYIKRTCELGICFSSERNEWVRAFNDADYASDEITNKWNCY